MRSGVSRNSNRTGGDKDREREGKGSIRLADAQVCQRYTEVFEIGELLLLIHSRFHIYS